MAHTFAMPKDSEARLRSADNGWASCQNLSLLLHQYVPHEVIDKGLIVRGRRDTQKAKEEADAAKRNWLAELAERSHVAPDSPRALLHGRLHLEWLNRIKAVATARQAIQFEAHTAGRLVVGLGGQSPVETDLLVHPIYGIPYIPGSALKGLTRAYARLEGLGQDGGEVVAEGKAPEEMSAYAEAETSEGASQRTTILDRLFGSQQQSGSVIFFDAVPGLRLRLDVDVMNPHYPLYYRDPEKHPPSDDQNPIPVPFLTVAKDNSFLFAVAPRNPRSAAMREDAQLAATWLKLALRDYGVGAKTNSGYGRFKVTHT